MGRVRVGREGEGRGECSGRMESSRQRSGGDVRERYCGTAGEGQDGAAFNGFHWSLISSRTPSVWAKGNLS